MTMRDPARARRRRLEQARVLERSVGVVNGAGANDNQQPAIRETEDFEDLLARLVDEIGSGVGNGALGFEGKRRVHDIGGPYAEIVNCVLHGDDRAGHSERSLDCIRRRGRNRVGCRS